MNTNRSNSIMSNLFWKFGERIFAQGLAFIISIVLARLLLPEDYGVVSLVLIFISFADVFIQSGFSTSLIQKKDADETDFSTIFYCSLLVSIIIYFILFLSAPYIAKFYNVPELTSILRVLCLRLPIGAYNSIQHAYVSRHMIFKKFFFSTLIGTIVSGIVGIVFAYSGAGVWALVAQYLTNSVMDSIVLAFILDLKIKFCFSIKSAKALMAYGWKVLVADFSGTFFDQLRSLIIGKYYAISDLSFYNKGKQFPSLVMDNITNSVMSVLFPAFSNNTDNKDKIKNMLSEGIKILAFVSFPLIFGLVAVAKPLIEILLTNKWIECVPYLQILSFSSVLGLIGNVSLQAIKATGRSDILLRLEIIKKPIYLLLLILGVKISVLAVAITMLIYTICGTIVNAFSLKYVIGYGFKNQVRDILSPLISSILMFLLVYMFRFIIKNAVVLLFIQVLIGVISYIVLSFVSNKETVKMLIDRIRGLKNEKA